MPAEWEICWEKKAKSVYDFVRVLSPYPGAWGKVKLNNNQLTLKIFKTAKTERTANGEPGGVYIEKGRMFVNTGDSLLEVLTLQQSVKKLMAARDFVNGLRL